jgi:hypothetical protein
MPEDARASDRYIGDERKMRNKHQGHGNYDDELQTDKVPEQATGWPFSGLDFEFKSSARAG